MAIAMSASTLDLGLHVNGGLGIGFFSRHQSGGGGFGYDPYAAGAFDQFNDAFSLRNDEQLVVKLAYRFEL